MSLGLLRGVKAVRGSEHSLAWCRTTADVATAVVILHPLIIA